MNIYTILLGLFLFFHGLTRLAKAFGDSEKSNLNELSKYNYFIVKINRILQPIADFMLGAVLTPSGAMIVFYGTKGMSILESLKKLIY